jgi:hypothetical protein
VKVYDLDDMRFGWFIGNFEPSLLKNEFIEVGIKRFNKGDKELTHHQIIATEWTCVVIGKVRIGDKILINGQILEILPHENADFEALEDSILVVVKSPSIPSDKIIV